MDDRTLCLSWGKSAVDVLKNQGVECKAREIVRASRVMSLRITLMDPSQIRKIMGTGMDEVLALGLGADAVRISRVTGDIIIEVGLPSQYHKSLSLSAIAREGNGVSVPIGVDTSSKVILFSLDDPTTPHALIAGSTGSGKSVLLQSIVLGLIRQNSNQEIGIIAIDGKQRGLMPFSSSRHLLKPLVVDMNLAETTLKWVSDELDRRMSNVSTPGSRIVVVIDEIAELLDRTGGTSGVVAELLRRLTAMGRELNIHVIAATQHPTVQVLGGSMAKANMPLRLVGRVMDAGASALATGQRGMSAHRLTGKGDFLAVCGDNNARFQVAMASQNDFAMLPKPTAVKVNEGISGKDAYDKGGFTAEMVGFTLSQMAQGRGGINNLSKTLGIGNERATALKAYALNVRKYMIDSNTDIALV